MWYTATGISCDFRLPTELRLYNVYKIVMLHGSASEAIEKHHAIT